jgi:hypothetical protein
MLVTGCGDPVRTTSQSVLLRVTDSASGAPIAHAQVSLKYDFDFYVPRPDKWNEWKRETYKWFSGKTDQDGKATVGIKWTVLDRTIGPTPPSWRDDVAGVAYMISTKKDQTHEQQSLIVQPGASTQGRVFTVQVVEIQPPRYVKTE